jgi:hypothetical protein
MQVKKQGRKPVAITVAWRGRKLRLNAAKWELSAMMVPICVFMLTINAARRAVGNLRMAFGLSQNACRAG